MVPLFALQAMATATGAVSTPKRELPESSHVNPKARFGRPEFTTDLAAI